MFGSFDFAILWANAPFLWNGMLLTLQLTGLAVTGGLLLGTVLAVARLSPIKPLAWVVEAYVNFLRSMPLILVIFWFYTLVPKLIGRPVSSFYSVLIAFVMFEAAYYSEIIRAGIQSVPRGQIEAAGILGLGRAQVFIEVVLPQAARAVYPAIINNLIQLLLGTSLLSAIALPELTGTATVINARTLLYIQTFSVTLIAYLVLSNCLSWIAEQIGARVFQPPLMLKQHTRRRLLLIPRQANRN